MPLAAALPRDPRHLQIAFLSSFLVAGVGWLGFDVPVWQPPLIVLTACLTQWAMTRLFRAPPVGYLSPVITSLGLSLLLRTDAFWVGPFAAAVAISGKFVLRVRGKHLFNPTNLGLVVAMLLTSHAWCSPSQWGHSGALLGWFAAFGLAVAHRSFRSDVSLAFLGSWVLLKAARIFYLGAPWTSLQHQLSARRPHPLHLLHDLRPEDDAGPPRGPHPLRRSVAGLGFFLLHGLWWQNALIWALCLMLSPHSPHRPCPALRPLPMAGRQGTGKERRMRFRLLAAGLTAGFIDARRARRRALSAASTSPRPTRALQRGLAGGAGARRRAHRAHHVQRLQGRAHGVRAGGAGAGRCSSGSRSTWASASPVERLDAYSAPRLVEYFDQDPCAGRGRT